MILGLQRGKVLLKKYNPEWVAIFEHEKEMIEDAFGDELARIEHIGSTAIPGMVAKPILDVMVAVDSIDDYEHFTPLFENWGINL